MTKLILILKYLNSYDIKGWVSGGTARDIFLDRSYQDIHISVKADFSTIQKLFKKRVVDLNRVHNYVKIKYKDTLYLLHPLTKTTLKNTYVSRSYTNDLEEDAKSKDFTINSLYYNPITNAWIDYFGGQEDAKNKTIRFIGDWKERVLESPIRLLRGPVLKGILGKEWSLDYNTSVGISAYHLKLMSIHKNLLYSELTKLFTRVEKPSDVFSLLRQLKLLNTFFPELSICIGIDQSQKRDHLDLYQHIMYALDSIPVTHNNVELVRLAAILHDIAKPQTEVISSKGRHFFNHEIVGKRMAADILTRWGYPSNTINSVQILVEHHLFNITSGSSKTAIKKFILRVSPDLIHDLLDLRIADIRGAGISKSTHAVENLRKKINTELMNLSPNNFKLALTDEDITTILKTSTETRLLPETTKACKHFLQNKIFIGRTHNKKTNLKKALKTLFKIPCPLEKYHLLKTWTSINTSSSDTFENGKLKCGVYCDFYCDKILNK